MIKTIRAMAVALAFQALLAANAAAQGSILAKLPASPKRMVSTVPANGDVNPYGVAFVPPGFAGGGRIHTGDILVSNFNNSSNAQGTGTTIVRVSPSGAMHLFFQGPAGLGLTTALGVLKAGFVIVGNVPTTDGSFATIQQGSLLILDRSGNLVSTLSDATFLNGPWDLTVRDMGSTAQVFVSNVLSGTVTRLDLAVSSAGVTVVDMVQIASGYTHRGDPAALAIGPTGLAYDASRDLLYVASTGDNEIFSVANAGTTTSDNGTGNVVYSDNAHLRGPLGLVLAPNGHLITTNGDAVNGDPTQPSEMVEFTAHGVFVNQVPVDTGGQGGAFGLAISGNAHNMVLAAVDDIVNALNVWRITPVKNR